MNYSNHKRSYIFKNNKRHLRADGLSLLLSALRPRLLAPVVAVAALAVSSGWLFPVSVSAVSPDSDNSRGDYAGHHAERGGRV